MLSQSNAKRQYTFLSSITFIGFSSLTALVSLDLSHNFLQQFPEELRKLSTCLRFLNLSCTLLSLNLLKYKDNLIDCLGTEIGRFSVLETFEISNNFLSSLPVEIVDCSKLKVLDVSHNEVNLVRLLRSHCS